MGIGKNKVDLSVSIATRDHIKWLVESELKLTMPKVPVSLRKIKKAVKMYKRNFLNNLRETYSEADSEGKNLSSDTIASYVADAEKELPILDIRESGIYLEPKCRNPDVKWENNLTNNQISKDKKRILGLYINQKEINESEYPNEGNNEQFHLDNYGQNWKGPFWAYVIKTLLIHPGRTPDPTMYASQSNSYISFFNDGKDSYMIVLECGTVFEESGKERGESAGDTFNNDYVLTICKYIPDEKMYAVVEMKSTSIFQNQFLNTYLGRSPGKAEQYATICSLNNKSQFMKQHHFKLTALAYVASAGFFMLTAFMLGEYFDIANFNLDIDKWKIDVDGKNALSNGNTVGTAVTTSSAACVLSAYKGYGLNKITCPPIAEAKSVEDKMYESLGKKSPRSSSSSSSTK